MVDFQVRAARIVDDTNLCRKCRQSLSVDRNKVGRSLHLVTNTEAVDQRLQILSAMITAIEHKDELPRLLDGSRGESSQAIAERFGFNDVQTHAVLDLQLHRLSDESLNRLKSERDDHQLP